MDGWMDGWMSGCVNGRMGGWIICRYMYVCMNGCLDEWMNWWRVWLRDRRLHKQCHLNHVETCQQRWCLSNTDRPEFVPSRFFTVPNLEPLESRKCSDEEDLDYNGDGQIAIPWPSEWPFGQLYVLCLKPSRPGRGWWCWWWWWLRALQLVIWRLESWTDGYDNQDDNDRSFIHWLIHSIFFTINLINSLIY